MNLTRMRQFGWVDYVTPIMLKWKLFIPWGDQVRFDLIVVKILCHFQNWVININLHIINVIMLLKLIFTH